MKLHICVEFLKICNRNLGLGLRYFLDIILSFVKIDSYGRSVVLDRQMYLYICARVALCPQRLTVDLS